MEWNLSFPLWQIPFSVMFKKHFLNPRSYEWSPVFSSKILVFASTFMSLTLLESDLHMVC